MRILQIINSLDSSQGGPSGMAPAIAVPLLERGVQSEILTLDCARPLEGKQAAIRVHVLKPVFLRRLYCFAPGLVPWLKANLVNYDLVIIHGIWRYCSFGAWLALRDSGKPYFVFTHGMLDPWFKRTYPLKHLKKWLYWPWAEYRVLRDAAAVFIASEREKVLARQSFWLYKCNEVVLNYGIEDPPAEEDLLRKRFFEKFPSLQGKRLILFLGRIHPKKGCDLLIKAFARVADRDQDLWLVMAGPDQIGWKKQLQAMARKAGVADRMTWPGMLSGEAKWGAYFAAEAFILPSHQENFGLTVAESLACGVPVLITDQVNIWESVRDANSGFVSRDDERGVVQLLEKWLSLSAIERRAMASRARVCFAEKFSIKKLGESMVQAFVANGIGNDSIFREKDGGYPQRH